MKRRPRRGAPHSPFARRSATCYCRQERRLRVCQKDPTRSVKLEELEQRRLLAAVIGGFNNEGTLLSIPQSSSFGFVSLGFNVNFLGNFSNEAYVDGAGNITLTEPNFNADPEPLATAATVGSIIAPFWADADTSGTGGKITYGTGTVDGHNAWGVEWAGVNYFNATNPGHVDLFNTFELVLVDRSTDPGNSPGDFDLEFNYNSMQWESGDNAGGTNGIGGNVARVGYAGVDPGGNPHSFELPGSGTTKVLLDGGTNALASNSLGSAVPGRYIFSFRNGFVVAPPPPDAPLTAGNLPNINASEGVTTGSVAVATFSDGDPNGTPAQFTANTSIDWGDGGSTPDVTSADNITGTPAQFNVIGHHTYKQAGTYTVKATVVDSGGSKVTLTGKATVADAPLTIVGTPQTISATEGTAYTTDLLKFTDADPGNPPPSNFTATINYNDGTAPVTVTPRQDGGPGTPFQVPSNHSFEQAGPLNVQVTITDNGNNSSPKQTITANISANITDAILEVAMSPVTTAVEGQSFTVPLGSFVDLDVGKAGHPENYFVTVDWGDGSVSFQDDPELLIIPFSNGPQGLAKFLVTGTHTYAEEGPHTITMKVFDRTGGPSAASTSASETTTVADAPLTAAGTPVTLSATAGTALGSQVLGSFTDADPNGAASDYTVGIDWGDPASPGLDTSSGAVVASGSQFNVTGGHTYATAGTYNVLVNVTDAGHATVTLPATITVASPTGHIQFDVVQPVDGQAQTIGFIDASTKLDNKGNTQMDTSFFLNPQFNYIEGCFQLHWFQVADDVNTTQTYNQKPVMKPIVDPPSGGYDPSGSSDTLPWYYLPSQETAVNQTTASGVQIFSLDDTPLGFAGATFDTYLVASYYSTQGPAFKILAGFHWDQGTFGGPATLAQDGAPNLVAINTAMTNAGFAGYSISAGSGTTGLDLGCHDLDFQFPNPPLDVARGVPIPATTVIATVTDRVDPNPAVGDFRSVTIDWGDGTTQAATLTQTGPINFNVTSAGTHAYNQIGTFTVRVTITQINGTQFVGSSIITVHNLAAAAVVAQATEGVDFTGTVALFADSNPAATAAEFAITIVWGDGGTSSGTAVANGGGVFTVVGTHRYVEQDILPVDVVIVDSDSDTATAFSAALVVDAPLTSIGNATTFTVREGDVASDAVVATFSDDNVAATLDDFVATINWGDGTPPTAGTVQFTPTGDSQFQVLGTHQYAEESPGAAPFLVTVTVIDEPGSLPNSSSLTASNTSFVVTDAPLEPNAASIATTEMATFTGTVGTFVDESPTGVASDFMATIDWGDGTPKTIGTVVATLQDTSSVHFNVNGTHVYSEDGPRAIRITLLDDGGATGTINSTATVADAPISAAGVAGTTTLTEGDTFDGVVATFTDPGSDGSTKDYSATIVWGDGTGPGGGIVSAGAGGAFTVTGSHIYDEGGATAIITIKDAGGSSATAATRFAVADAPLTGGGTTTVNPVVIAAPNALPEEIINGPGGDLWFVEQNTGKLGRIDPTTGTLIEFSLPDFGDDPTGITTGPDGAIWFAETDRDKIGRFDPSTGAVTEFDIPTPDSFPTGIVEGPDGALWFTERLAGQIGRLDPSTGNVTEFPLPVLAIPVSIIVGPDNNLWCSLFSPSAQGVAQIQTSGTITPFATTTSDSDTVNDVTEVNGYLWVTESGANIIAQVGTNGAVKTYPIPTSNSDPQGIAADASGNLWFAELNANQIGELTPPGTIIEYPLPTTGGRPLDLTFDDAGHLWYTDSGTNAIEEFIPPSAQQVITVAAGAAFTETLVSFDDAFAAAPVTDFTATINWGDGSTTTGNVIANGGGSFHVQGTHTYTSAGTFSASVSVDDKGGSSVTQTATLVATAPFSIVDHTYTIGAGTVSVSAADGLLSGDKGPTLSATAGTITGAQGGTFTINIDGSFTYIPGTSFPGYDSTHVTVTDTSGDKGKETVTVLSQHAGVVWKFYESVLNRTPDPGGLQYWTNYFNNGGQTGQLAVGFFESTELLDKIITNYYEEYLLRDPDSAGLSYWRGVWQATGGPEQIKAGFADSPEFYNSAGGTPQSWITQLYRRILDRAPDPGGESYWLNYYQQQTAAGVDAGTVRYQIALGFFDSAESYGQDVTGWFQEYLFRAPRAAEQAQYVSQMEAGATDRTIEEETTNLPEFSSNPPTPPEGTAAPLPDYYQMPASGAQSQAALAAKDAFFSGL